MTGWAAEFWKLIGLCILHHLHQLGYVKNLEISLFSISRTCPDHYHHHSLEAQAAFPAMFCLYVEIVGSGLKSGESMPLLRRLQGKVKQLERHLQAG